MKKAKVFFICLSLCLCGLSFTKSEDSIGVWNTLDYFAAQAKNLTTTLESLQSAVSQLDSQNKNNIVVAKQRLVESRRVYKRIEFFVTYFFSSRIAIFNPAPVYEVEEPYMEFQSPVGLQVIEGLLFDDRPNENKLKLLEEIGLLLNTAKGLPSFLYGEQILDNEILESMRLELIRIMTLGITGYDAPQLKSGVEESREALLSIQENLRPYLGLSHSQTVIDVADHLQRSIKTLDSKIQFDDFNRLDFLTNDALPLQEAFGRLIKQLGLLKNRSGILNYEAANLFSKNAFNLDAINGIGIGDQGLIAFGEKLFFDTRLSGNGQRSCATCHNPQRFFTDGLDKSPAFNGHDKVARNAPSILYAAYQHGQFWDARSSGLEAQILQVLQSETEMNAGLTNLNESLNQDSSYRRFSNASIGNKPDSFFTIKNIAKALAAFESSLPIMTSKFDEYIAGNKTALTAKQIKGFNLFTGKAQCGTCHFAPLFNGLLRPLFDRTELESLGMVRSGDFKKPVSDKDDGRFAIFPIEFYKGAFKTPTVRNSAMTAPFMHNGAFKTMKAVIEFYNKGGGAGLGLPVPYQTLSSKPLQLSASEKAALISFLQSLTDRPLVQFP